MALDSNELKTLAIELAAAIPPASEGRLQRDVLDSCDTLFNDLSDARAMLVCVTGEGMDGFNTLSSEVQESYLYAVQRRVDSALYAYHALTAAMRKEAA